MDTNRIRYFLSLAKTESVTKAAELHHISPAAFSKAMKIFENEVGETLTLPVGRGLMLTDYARSIVPSLQSIIGQIDSIKDKSQAMMPSEKLLRIATFEVFSTHFMAQAIKDYFPEFHCVIHEMIPGRMEEAVLSGKVDFALTYIPVPHRELDFLKIKDIQMGIFGHPSLLKNDNLGTLPFAVPVSPVEGSPNKVRGLDGWPDDAFPRLIQFQVQMMETALGLCRQGIAVAYLPHFVVRMNNETVIEDLRLEALELPKKFPKRIDSVYIIKRKSDIEEVRAKRLAQAIRKICR